ncbi:HlyD family efflux transporter periplasmic adaptor subunit [Leptolyngbya ohadii]|uniref:HlyD family efflux transporter periplasmic adaptor subunit n=1 Tax=Leptolyngbya ohadii TaxID=1962290 RepID=UPI000B5998D4|nr:HlyD family efflux transporter periplasmic adaptor subunit [Leptolyngbya ohadii]
MMQKQFARVPGYWLVLAIGCFGIAALAVQRTLSPAPSAEKTLVAAPQPVRAVAALGRIEPESSIIKVSVANASDSRVDRLLVKEGDRVQAGQVIAILQGLEKQQAAVIEAENNVAIERAKLRQTQAGSGNASQIRAQEAAIAQLQAELSTDRAAKQASLGEAEAELQNAKQTYDRYRQLFEQGAISAAALDNYRKDYRTAQARVAEAQAMLANTVKTLNAQIKQAKATLNNLSEVRPVDVSVPQAEIRYALSQLASEEARLDDYYVRAPAAGQILRINTQIGEQVDAEAGIVDLGQTDRMAVIAEVYETDVSKIETGQRATITSENGGFTEELEGTVEQIGLQIQKVDILGTDPAADSNARVVEVKILLDQPSSEKVARLTNMQVRVKIHQDDRQ